MTVRTRFAPSPTGSLHVGGVRTALYCLLYARKHGGTFVLRIEDTDQARSTDEAAQGIMRDLRWCGLLWDEGPGTEKPGDCSPYFQSRRLDIYNRIIDQLLASSHAYYAWDSREELEAMRKDAEARKDTFRYRFRPTSPDEEARYRAEGRIPVVRLKSPTHDITVHDNILGDVTVRESELEDIVCRKADGFPTYHFAVVVDDHFMAIDQILRGQEHLLNTPKHIGIYEALGWAMPNWGHLPLIYNPAGQKMSKREKAKEAREALKKAQDARKAAGHDPADYSWIAAPSGLDAAEIAAFARKEHDRIPVAEAIARVLGVRLPMIEVMDFRRGGYYPEALINYMALLGWNPGDDRELLSLDEMIAAFSLDRVNRTAAKFDPEKLRWMNGEYIKRTTAKRWLEVVHQYREVTPSILADASDEKLVELLQMYRDRVSTVAELESVARFFFFRPSSYDEKALRKNVLGNDGVAVLEACHRELEICDWTAAGIEAALAPIADGQLGRVAQPLRVAMSGTAVSPPIFETIAFFDRAEALARLDACLAAAKERA